jgi:hypothetical protein
MTEKAHGVRSCLKGQKGTGCFWLHAGYESIETADTIIKTVDALTDYRLIRVNARYGLRVASYGLAETADWLIG